MVTLSFVSITDCFSLRLRKGRNVGEMRPKSHVAKGFQILQEKAKERKEGNNFEVGKMEYEIIEFF